MEYYTTRYKYRTEVKTDNHGGFKRLYTLLYTLGMLCTAYLTIVIATA